MQTTSALYKSIFADVNHIVEWKITVNGTAYTGDQIAADTMRPRLPRSLFSGMQPSVGECVAAMFSCAIYEASSAVPRMASVVPAYRLVLGSSQSEWINLGTFYIDTRTVDRANGALILNCYDRMLVADGAGGRNYADLTGFTTWPQPQASVAAEIAAIMGVTVDARTVIRSGAGYTVEYPNDLTMREVLGYIGVANAGNWCITPANALRLVPLTGSSDSFALGAAASGLKTSPALAAWTGVVVYYDDEAAFSAGDETGRVLTCECPWATQATADGILAALSGSAYQPYTADGAIIDLALELGDVVTVGLPDQTVPGPVISIDVTVSGLEQADISAPGEDEIDHEYPYASYVDRSLRRKVTLGQSYYGTSISRDKGIEIKRSDGASEAVFNSDTFAMRARIDGAMRDRIYFDPVKGDYVFDGALGADAVFTDSLYAEVGDVSELTVDRLSTSRRVRKFILSDTSDDNYITIQDNYVRFITGRVQTNAVLATESDAPLLTSGGHYLQVMGGGQAGVIAQAKNRNNQPLYWQREPVSHTTDGYPLDSNGSQIYATTETTDWPVYQYVYKELIKASFSFAAVAGQYQPLIVLGAGDENGNSKGFIYKTPTGLDVIYKASSGDELSVKFGDSGYVDVNKMRRPISYDFSHQDEISEVVDGNVYLQYALERDAQGRITKITNLSDGHETVVNW